jgi:hypothetical protein
MAEVHSSQYAHVRPTQIAEAINIGINRRSRMMGCTRDFAASSKALITVSMELAFTVNYYYNHRFIYKKIAND